MGRVARYAGWQGAARQYAWRAFVLEHFALRYCGTGSNTEECEEKTKDAAPFMDFCFG